MEIYTEQTPNLKNNFMVLPPSLKILLIMVLNSTPDLDF